VNLPPSQRRRSALARLYWGDANPVQAGRSFRGSCHTRTSLVAYSSGLVDELELRITNRIRTSGWLVRQGGGLPTPPPPTATQSFTTGHATKSRGLRNRAARTRRSDGGGAPEPGLASQKPSALGPPKAGPAGQAPARRSVRPHPGPRHRVRGHVSFGHLLKANRDQVLTSGRCTLSSTRLSVEEWVCRHFRSLRWPSAELGIEGVAVTQLWRLRYCLRSTVHAGNSSILGQLDMTVGRTSARKVDATRFLWLLDDF